MTVVERFCHEIVVPDVTDDMPMDIPLDTGTLYTVPGQLSSGQTAPAFEIPRVGGGTMTLEDFKDKNLLLCFYGQYQIKSDPEINLLRQLYENYKDRTDFAMVGVLLAGQSIDKFNQKMLEHFALTWPHGQTWPYESKMYLEYDVKEYPYMVLIDGDGIILGANLKGDALLSAVNEALGTD
jgi:peroxiredoxin